ncbi:hypothetical protein K438DRAFT_338135 [Mycena galopus ATCC 62051]|nr:hypothetical protein K438DRAFT_338135 [Mycena galopus ATCC 62051]
MMLSLSQSLSFTAGSVALLPSQTLPSASRPFTHNKSLAPVCPPIREAVLLRRFQGLPKFVSLFFPSRATDWNAYISGTYGFWFYSTAFTSSLHLHRTNCNI